MIGKFRIRNIIGFIGIVLFIISFIFANGYCLVTSVFLLVAFTILELYQNELEMYD